MGVALLYMCLILFMRMVIGIRENTRSLSYNFSVFKINSPFSILG